MTKRSYHLENSDFYQNVVALLRSAKHQAVQQINQTLVQTYFQIGKMIVEEEQKGKDRGRVRQGRLWKAGNQKLISGTAKRVRTRLLSA